jgi:pimeloyl-ACP methyl ester carboxylesterase
LPPLLALHGFGSSKEDYYDLMLRPENRGRGFYAFDLPGLAASKIETPEKASIDFLVALTLKFIDLWNIGRFHICGHSMGGLAALYVADKLKNQVLSFINIEGNVASEDTFMSAQVVNYPARTPEEFFSQFIERTAQVEQYGYASYVAAIRHRISPTVVLPYLKSIYDHSQEPDLLQRFLALPAGKMFVHGEQNSSLSYLSTLKEKGVKVLSVPFASHFPMKTNPVFLFDHMSRFMQETEEPDHGKEG